MSSAASQSVTLSPFPGIGSIIILTALMARWQVSTWRGEAMGIEPCFAVVVLMVTTKVVL